VEAQHAGSQLHLGQEPEGDLMSDAAYQRKYRAEASEVWKAKENERNKAWWRAHRRLAKEYRQRFIELYEEEKASLAAAKDNGRVAP